MVYGKFINNSGFDDQLDKKHDTDVGLDLKAVLKGKDIETILYTSAGEIYVRNVDDIVIQPRGRACIHTMINMKTPDGCYGQIASRSGLCRDYGVVVDAGVIDPEYIGLVQVMLFNNGFYPFVVKHGMKIAQLITIYVNSERYEQVDNLDDTDRGSAGFGSTGV